MSKQVVNNHHRSGVGFVGLLTLLFIGLKLGEVGQVAQWSWIWVLSPVWIVFGLFAGIVLFFLVVAGLCYAAAGVAWLFQRLTRKVSK